MKKIIIYSGELTIEKVNISINEIDEALKEYEAVILYFSSEGGIAPASKIFTDYINLRKDSIEVIALDQISSSALELMVNIGCKKTILDYTLGVAHIYTTALDYRNFQDKNYVDMVTYRSLKKQNKVIIQMFEKVLSEKDIKRLLNGDNIALTTNQLRKLIA